MGSNRELHELTQMITHGSDTITTPVDELFEVMKTATRGDDVYSASWSSNATARELAAGTDPGMAHRRTKRRLNFRKRLQKWPAKRLPCLQCRAQW